MGYSEKKKMNMAFVKALNDLRIFATRKPALPLKNRRYIVASIYLGGDSIYKKNAPEYFGVNYQRTFEGLTKACYSKMRFCPQKSISLRRSIYILSSLATWARTNPNRSRAVLNNFVTQIVPEDIKPNSEYSPITQVLQKLYDEQGLRKTMDFMELSHQVFCEKYRGR